MLKKTRALSFAIIFFAYILAFAAACWTYGVCSGTPLLRMLAADAAATLVVWAFGVAFNNSSVYDPYWSVAPLAILPAWMAVRGGTLSFLDVLYLIAFFVWGIRLTLNWAFRFYGLAHQDWRYSMYKRNSPKFWFFINLFGINLMPTAIVFGGLVPAYFGIFEKGGVNAAVLIGFLLSILCACIQFASDNQMTRFRKASPEACIEAGLWRISRHPNYLGEVLFWWGIYIMQLGALPQFWYTAIGPAAITLLFVFISIPMMERHVSETRPSYTDYKKRVPMLVPWFGRRLKG